MTEHLLIGLTVVLILGVGAQWLAWRLRLPSILLLLLLGFAAGPVTGLVDPDHLLGELLFPIVSISVAIIMFEGGLTLRLSELPKIGGVMFRLISLGALVTWAIAAVAAHYILALDWSLAILLGAILVVTGPTVIGPLLRQIRPKGEAGAVLKWEGILIDPVGAVLAVLVFEVILGGDFQQAPGVIVAGVLLTILIGLILGLIGAGLMIILMRRYWVPDHLQNGVALLLAIALFAFSNELQHESGLLTVTVMGFVLANQKWIAIKHIVEFKENLRVLLIGSLFILLAARLQLDDVINLGWQGLAFLAILILITRPLSVFFSSWRSQLTFKERLFISWMAPRGIVAASVASIFAFELVEAGHAGAEKLVAVTFLVIVGTVALYGLTAEPLARRLGLSEQNPQGMLIVGGHAMARAIAAAIQEHGFRALLVDTNRQNVTAAKLAGLEAHYGNALSEEMLDELDMTGIGRLLALTSNHEVNSLAALHFPEIFSRAEIYQLPPKDTQVGVEHTPQHLSGRFLFNSQMTFARLNDLIDAGSTIKATKLTNVFTYVDLQNEYDSQAIPLFLITRQNELIVYTVDYQPIPRAGQTLISLIPADGRLVEDIERHEGNLGEQTFKDLIPDVALAESPAKTPSFFQSLRLNLRQLGKEAQV
ncbi:MAG: sodium:proton antiporter [Ardenticatenaceae bacterium]|nr:sodium:proton antiporter [Ardenticatenaceae bacterium]